jgi:tetratricopeptide (TPR) repeat protein
MSMSGIAGGSAAFIDRNLEVNVKTPDGKLVDSQVLVQLITVTGKLYAQTTARKGQARFNSISRDEFRVLVTAPGYQRGESRVDLSINIKLASVDVQLVPMADAEQAASAKSAAIMNPKAQKELNKAVEALRAKKPTVARSHLEAAQKASPDSADVEYVFGIYSAHMNDPAQAMAHWNKALSYNPQHLSALLEVSQQLIQEKKAADASSYLQRALQADPSSWRAHAFSAEAAYTLGDRDEAIKQARRAIELGRDHAAAMEPFLAGLLFETGDTEHAVQTMQKYVNAHPSDTASAKQLEEWKSPAPALARTAARLPVSAEFPLPPNWMPPDVDEKIPPVEPGAVCLLDEVVQKTGERITTLVHDVDRFTATESINDETINKSGLPSAAEKQKFAYTVSIQEMRPGLLTVDEYRNNEFGHSEFPDGVITTGLPALVLVFHPFYAGNYEMTCEGLTRSSGGLAWQVHFRQRPDKPIQLRGFRVGALGAVHPAALRGRAWIAADTNQIVRLETDLVAPIPEIRLNAEHIAVEYGAVNFRKENIDLWLPRSAEVHFDWRGQRVHRRHSFDHYLLFSIDENERIGSPKGEKQPAASDSSPETRPPS